MGFLDKMKDLASKNADKVDMAIEKVGDAVDTKTGNKYQSTVDKVQEAAKKAASGDAETHQEPPAAPAGPPAAPAGPPPTS